ncbi:hypothetical protein L1987_33414 [Smallanthus sonchifolius]|uniref:Uncharacterized protein n=1 Tax=Smallanthus sonchifolius TaxID=185202 RepID=A0ACB9HSB0_9ASTR|nr:hypothetical protein L1987_33414 [Smallanthus sonchifolius]
MFTEGMVVAVRVSRWWLYELEGGGSGVTMAMEMEDSFTEMVKWLWLPWLLRGMVVSDGGLVTSSDGSLWWQHGSVTDGAVINGGSF